MSKSIIRTTEEQIKKYAYIQPIDTYTKKKYSTLPNGEKEITKDVITQINDLCIQHINKQRSIKELEECANDILFTQYSPKILSKILSEDFYNFLFILGEYSEYDPE